MADLNEPSSAASTRGADTSHPYTSRRVTFSYLFALYFILGGSETIISPLFPLIRDDLHLNESHQAAILAAVAAGIASFNVVCGVLSHWLTDRSLVRLAVLTLIFGMLLSGIAPSFWVLLLGQALLGIAFGLYFPPALAAVARLYPTAPGKAIASYGLAYSFGLTVAALSGNVGSGDWRWVFIGCVVPAVAAFVFTPRWAEPEGDHAPKHMLTELRAYVQVHAYRLSALASLGGVSMHYVVIGFAPVYFVDQGIDLRLVVSLIAAGRALSAAAKLIGGALYDRHGGAWTARLMMLTTFAFGLGLLLLPARVGVWMLVPFVGVAVSVMPVANAMLVASLPPKSGWGIGTYRAGQLGAAALLSGVVSVLLRWLPLESLMLASLSLPMVVALTMHRATKIPHQSE